VWLRALLVWVLLVVLAILNGTGREALLSPRLGATAGHLVSSVLLASLICPTAWLTIPGIAPGTARRAWAVGVLWVVLTIAFEFLAGHYAFGHAWPKLRAKEMVDRGRVELPTPGFSVPCSWFWSSKSARTLPGWGPKPCSWRRVSSSAPVAPGWRAVLDRVAVCTVLTTAPGRAGRPCATLPGV